MNTAVRLFFIASLSISLALTGCASHRPVPPAPLPDARSVTIFRGSDGTKVEWSELIQTAADADVVILGENHGHPLGLSIAAAIWADVASPDDSNAALALEFFERDQQSRIDDYLAGLTDEATFKKKTSRTDGNYPPGHREMLELAKAKNHHVIASNAPSVYVRAAKTKGFEAMEFLSESQSRLFKIPDAIPEGKYRESFDKVMGNMTGHGDPKQASGTKAATTEPTPEEKEEAAAKKKLALDAAFRSQCMWDWTMADSIFKAWDKGDKPVVQVVGRFHCDFHGGIVQALEHYDASLNIKVITFVDQSSESLKDEDKDRGDFVIYVGPSKD